MCASVAQVVLLWCHSVLLVLYKTAAQALHARCPKSTYTGAQSLHLCAQFDAILNSVHT